MIKFTEVEKEEFDRLCFGKDDIDFRDFMNIVAMSDGGYPNLRDHLFSGNKIKDRKAQSDFIRALEKPSLIEVEEKKYYVHLFKDDEDSYLNYNPNDKTHFLGNKAEVLGMKTKFTKHELANIKDMNFKLDDDALEEVKK